MDHSEKENTNKETKTETERIINVDDRGQIKVIIITRH